MRIGIIINPGSGRRSATRHRFMVEQIGADGAADIALVVYEGSERIESLVSRMVREVDLLGVVGGHGTLNGVINGVMHSENREVPVFFLPAGRGSDTARTLPSPTPKDASIRPLAYRTSKIDLGLLSLREGGSRYFINESSIGLGAFAARSASRLPRRIGSAAYLLGTIDGLFRSPTTGLRLNIEGVGTVELPRCHHLTVANGRYFGAGLQIAPDASAVDGLLDIVAVADASAVEIARALPQLLRCTHLTHPSVQHWQSTGVTIESSINALIETDGEQWEAAPHHYSLVTNALTWLEPI
jgi:diacylglycerol kinase (ATP)